MDFLGTSLKFGVSGSPGGAEWRNVHVSKRDFDE